MKVLIYTVSFGNPKPDYVSLSCKINSDYCNAHGYEFKEFELDASFERHPAWGRVWFLKENLADYDYMFYIDGDAFFCNQSKTLNAITGYLDEPQVCGIFARDQMLDNVVFHSDLANAGSFMFSKNTYGVELANKWWNVPLENYTDTIYDSNRYLDNTDTLHHHPYEQLALWFLWRENSLNFRFVKNYKELNGLNGEFVRHLIKVPDAERSRIMSGYINE